MAWNHYVEVSSVREQLDRVYAVRRLLVAVMVVIGVSRVRGMQRELRELHDPSTKTYDRNVIRKSQEGPEQKEAEDRTGPHRPLLDYAWRHCSFVVLPYL